MSDDIDWSGILASGRLPTATKAQRAAMKRRQAREEKRREAERSARPAPVQLDLLDRPTPSAPARVWAADAPPTGTIAGVTAMNNRLVALERHGLATGRREGRQRLWTATKQEPRP